MKDSSREEEFCSLQVERTVFLKGRWVLLFYSALVVMRLLSSLAVFGDNDERHSLWNSLYEELNLPESNKLQQEMTTPGLVVMPLLLVGWGAKAAQAITIKFASVIYGSTLPTTALPTSAFYITKFTNTVLLFLETHQTVLLRLVYQIIIGASMIYAESFLARGLFFRFGGTSARWFLILSIFSYEAFYMSGHCYATFVYLMTCLIYGSWLREKLSTCCFLLGLMSPLAPSLACAMVPFMIPRYASDSYDIVSCSLSILWYTLIGFSVSFGLDELIVEERSNSMAMNFMTSNSIQAWKDIFNTTNITSYKYGLSQEPLMFILSNPGCVFGFLLFCIGISVAMIRIYFHVVNASKRLSGSEKVHGAFNMYTGVLHTAYVKQQERLKSKASNREETENNIKRSILYVLSDVSFVYLLIFNCFFSFAAFYFNVHGAMPHMLISLNLAAAFSLHFLFRGDTKTDLANRMGMPTTSEALSKRISRFAFSLLIRCAFLFTSFVGFGRILSSLNSYHLTNTATSYMEYAVQHSLDKDAPNTTPTSASYCLTQASAEHHAGPWFMSPSVSLYQLEEDTMSTLTQSLPKISLKQRHHKCDYIFDRTAKSHFKGGDRKTFEKAATKPLVELNEADEVFDFNYQQWLGCGLLPVQELAGTLFDWPGVSSFGEYYGHCLWLTKVGTATYDIKFN